MRFLLLILCVFAGTAAFSQNNELLRSRGMLPPNITGTVTQQNAYEIQRIKKRNEVIPGDQYTLIRNTVELCQEIAESGRLMINDTLSSYANKVLDHLLRDDIELRKQLCVYFYYSTGTNAVTLSNGMIIIELGLMAHIKNEAQLAVILSHEVSHYRQNHFLKSYRYAKNARREGDPLSKVLQYSRELEQEADSLGFEIYKSSGYALSEAVNVLETLQYSDIAEEQSPFNPHIFERGLYKFPSYYLADSLVAVDMKEYDEAESTHPSCENRKKKMQLFIRNLNSEGTKFIFPESVFNALRLIAREECCILYLEDRNFGEAIYCAYVLLIEDSTNVTAKKIIGKGLYNLAAYTVRYKAVIMPQSFIIDYDEERDFDFGKKEAFIPLPNYKKVPGESQRLHYFLAKLSNAEMTILAMRWNWEIYCESGLRDETELRICEHLFTLLTAYNGMTRADFDYSAIATRSKKMLFDTATKEIKLEIRQEIRDYRTGDTKSIDGKLREPDFSLDNEDLAEYCYRGFDQIPFDTLFSRSFRKKEGSDRLAFEYPDNIWQESQKNRYKSLYLGITKMYLYAPECYKLTEIKLTRTYQYDAQASAALQKQHKQTLSSSAKSVHKDFFMLTPQTMDSTRVADYNTYCMLQQWLWEQSAHSSTALALNLAHAEFVDSLISKLGTQYVMTSSIVCEKQKRVRYWGSYIAALAIPFTAPIAIIYGLTPRHRSQMESYVFDLKTGNLIFIYEDYTKTNATPGNVGRYYSHVFHKILD